MLECATNKSLLWNQKRCPILVFCKSSFEVDRRVPGNRDEFPFSQAEWSLQSYFLPLLYVSREVQFNVRKPNVTIYSYIWNEGLKDIENNTWARVDIEFLFECLTP